MAESGSKTISYEVYKQVGGRWEIHSHYGDDKRDLAIKDAVTIDGQGNVQAVRVIREEYDDSDNTNKEAVIYQSESLGGEAKAKTPEKKPEKKSKKKPKKKSAPKPAKPRADKPSRPKKPKREEPDLPSVDNFDDIEEELPERMTAAELLPQISIAFMVSTVISTLVAWASLVGMKALAGIGFGVGATASQTALIFIFGLTFVGTFVPMMKRLKVRAQRTRAAALTAAAESLLAPTGVPIEPPIPMTQATEEMLDAPAVDAAAPEEERKRQRAARQRALSQKQVSDADTWLRRFIVHCLKLLAKLGRLDAYNRFGLPSISPAPAITSAPASAAPANRSWTF